MFNCPRCNGYVAPGAPYCPNCNFSFVGAQFAPIESAESKREKRYKYILIVLGGLFIFDGVVWRIMQKVSESFGFEVYTYIKPYTYLVTPIFAGIPALIGFMLPKSTPWRWVLIIAGSLWFAFRMFEFIRQEFFNPYIDYKF